MQGNQAPQYVSRLLTNYRFPFSHTVWVQSEGHPGLGQSSKFIQCSTSLASQPSSQQCMQRTQRRAHCSLYNTCWIIRLWYSMKHSPSSPFHYSIPPFHSTECRHPSECTCIPGRNGILQQLVKTFIACCDILVNITLSLFYYKKGIIKRSQKRM